MMHRCKKQFYEFSESTSSHGISYIASSKSYCGRSLWLLLFTACLIIASVQAYFLITKFTRFDIVVHISLKFDPPAFPAVTICNMNPYKLSSLGQVKNVQDSLDVFSMVKDSGKSKPRGKRSHEIDIGRSSKPPIKQRAKRLKRGRKIFRMWSGSGNGSPSKRLMYEPVQAHCYCHSENQDCVPILKEASQSVMCYCFRDITSDSIWPCYSVTEWTLTTCQTCLSNNRCSQPLPPEEIVNITSGAFPCMCHSVDNSCVRRNPVISLYGAPKPVMAPAVTPNPKAVANLGFKGVSDETALSAKARENIVFGMANVGIEQRINMSYSLEEMIHECSFDKTPCDIDADFKRRVTPTFGNCYAFNHWFYSNLTASRSGPDHGLRILVYANISDYLPTTTSAGIRIAIHDPQEYPFPNALGYNAPTGLISSIGLKLKKVNRLSTPYGDCVKPDFRYEGFIYEERYTVEACYRSCLQNEVINECGCGDPRLPNPFNNITYCHLGGSETDTANSEKVCLEEVQKYSAGGSNIKNCVCKQPCEQSMYLVTYSAARWPAKNYDAKNCSEGDTQCILDYRTNAAFLEIYYEQSNYEVAEEREAYGWASLMSDFGGQLGLWMGFSVITILEWCILVFKLTAVCCSHGRRSSTHTPLDEISSATPMVPLKHPTKDDLEQMHHLLRKYRYYAERSDTWTEPVYCNNNVNHIA